MRRTSCQCLWTTDTEVGLIKQNYSGSGSPGAWHEQQWKIQLKNIQFTDTHAHISTWTPITNSWPECTHTICTHLHLTRCNLWAPDFSFKFTALFAPNKQRSGKCTRMRCVLMYSWMPVHVGKTCKHVCLRAATKNDTQAHMHRQCYISQTKVPMLLLFFFLQ